MRTFDYKRATSASDAVEALRARPGAKFIAGGTNLLDLMKIQIEAPTHLVDINHIGLNTIEETADGGLRIGALVRNTDLAADQRVRSNYAVLARALIAGASGQLRNRATTAGNLLQRTRCPYFYDPDQPCNKRNPGSGCSAIGGFSRSHAIIGVSDSCIAAHPSDMAVALRALDATIEALGSDGSTRTIAVADLHRLPDDTPNQETTLEHDELITSIVLPAPFGGKHFYRKVRDRASYAFALVSVAAIIQDDGSARLAFGGVAPKPWRVEEAESLLLKSSGHAVAAIFDGARPTHENAFKTKLAERTLDAIVAEARG